MLKKMLNNHHVDQRISFLQSISLNPNKYCVPQYYQISTLLKKYVQCFLSYLISLSI